MSAAIFLGIIFANLTSVPHAALPGIEVLGKKMLRLAVALLGLQLTLEQVAEVGASGVFVLVVVITATYGFTVGVGWILGVHSSLSRLLAAGTSICGASAIAAVNGIEKGRDEHVAYAVACITLFGTIAMVIYPLAAQTLSLGSLDYGFWTGASVHEVAQVAAAGFQQGEEAGEFGIVVKLSRVLLLAPLLIVIGLLARRQAWNRRTSLTAGQMFPVFVAGFIVAMLANSVGIIPAMVNDVFVQVTPVMLTAALGALGLGTRFSALKAQGLRPILLAGLATLFISSASLMLLPLTH